MEHDRAPLVKFRNSPDRAESTRGVIGAVSRLIVVLMFSMMVPTPAASEGGVALLLVSTLQAGLPRVIDVEVDYPGRLLALDTVNGSVYRFLPNGTRTTLATGFNTQYSVAIDRTTDIAYITDTLHHCIKFVTNNGTNETIAGLCGSPGYSDGVGTAARFSTPTGLVLHNSGVLYISDYDNKAIRKISITTSNVTTLVAGASLSRPFMMCINRAGTQLYVTFRDSHFIARIDLVPTTPIMTTIAGSNGGAGYVDGIGSSARFYNPSGIALHHEEKVLYVADRDNFRTRSIRLSNAYVDTVAGNGTNGYKDGPAMMAQFGFVYGIKWYCNTSHMNQCGLLVADLNGIVRWISSNASLSISGSTSVSRERSGSVTPSSSVSAHSRSVASRTATVASTLSASHSQSQSFSAAVPLPRTITALEQVRDGITAATPVLQYSFGAVSTSAGSISRMGAVSKIGNCQTPFAPPQGLLSSRIVGCGGSISRSVAAEFARGDAVLAVVVLLCVASLLLACCALYAHAQHMPLWDGVASLSMPSLLLPLWGATLPTGVGGIVALSRNWEGCAGDGVLLLFGVAIVVVLPMALLVFGTVVMRQRLQILRRVATEACPLQHARCAPLQRALDVAQHRQWSWEPLPGATPSVHLYGRVVVLQHRLLWYATLDAAVLVAVSALGASAVDLPLGTCQALGGAIVALLSLQLLVCGVSRPFTTLFDHVVTTTTLTLNVVGAALQLSLLDDAATAVSGAAAAVDLLLLGLSAVKAALDGSELLHALRRRWVLLSASGLLGAKAVLDASSMKSLHVDEVGDVAPAEDPQLLLEDDDELDILVPPMTDHVGGLADAKQDEPRSSLALAYAAMGDAELPWEEDVLASAVIL